MPINKRWKYGDPYPDQLAFPHHKLVYVGPQTVDKWSRWYYASDRLNQDEYNWEFTSADIGGNKFDAVSRTYLVSREAFDATSPALGSPMPNVPKDKFIGDYVLAGRVQQRTGEQELDSLYVLEKRIYIKRCTLTEILGSKLSLEERIYHEDELINGISVKDLFADPNNAFWEVQSDGSSRVGRQLSCDWYMITTQKELAVFFIWPTPNDQDYLFYVVRTANTPPTQTWNYGDTFGGDHPNHKLVYVSPVDEKGRSRFYYASDRINQDAYNWEAGQIQVGGITADSVTRTYLVKREDFSPDSYTIGAPMPNVPEGKFSGTWKLFNVSQKRTGEQEFDSLYVTLQLTYVQDTAAIGMSYGKIVTEDIKVNVLVPENTQPDTGIEILSSQVTPIGNGLATKETRSVTGGVWPDPVEKQVSKSRENLIPQKFRSFITRLLTSRKVADVPDSVTLGGNVVGKEYVRETPDRVDERVIEEVLDEGATPLLGKQMITTFGGGIADTSESLVGTLEEIVGGFNVVSESVTPLGNGKFIKEKVSVEDAWPTLQGSKYDADLDISIPFSEEVVPAGTTGGRGVDIDPLDKWRVKKRVQDVDSIVSELEGIHVILPTQQNIQLPNTLQSVKVIVSRTLGNGNSISMGNSYSLGMDSAVSVSADLTWQVKEGYSGPVDAEIHVFYMPLGGVTAEDIQTKVGAQPWPQYSPVSHRLVITGHGVTKSYDSRGSNDSFSLSESATVSALTNSAVLPQCINDSIDVEIEYIDLEAPTTGLDTAIDAKIAEYTAKNEQAIAEVDSGFYLGIPITAAQAIVLKARLESNLNELRFAGDLVLTDFPVEVRPSTISPTSPAAIVEGKYVYSANVQQYAYGMVRVTAVVVNLTGV